MSLSHRHSLTHGNDQFMTSPSDCGEMSQREAVTYRLHSLQPYPLLALLWLHHAFMALYTCKTLPTSPFSSLPAFCPLSEYLVYFVQMSTLPPEPSPEPSPTPGRWEFLPCLLSMKWTPPPVCPRDSLNVLCSTPNPSAFAKLIPLAASPIHKWLHQLVSDQIYNITSCAILPCILSRLSSSQILLISPLRCFWTFLIIAVSVQVLIIWHWF